MKNISRVLSPKIAKLLLECERVTPEILDALPEHTQDALCGLLQMMYSAKQEYIDRQLPSVGKIARGEVSLEPQDYTWIKPYLPTVLPVEWKKTEDMLDGAVYQATNGRMVILSGQIYRLTPMSPKERWLHLSVSAGYGEKIPSWRDLVQAKELFLGTDSRAIQVIPPRSEYVNINPSVLHLWVCVDRELLPDFTQGSGSL